MTKERRVKLLSIPSDLILGVLEGKCRVSNIPEGSQLLRATYNFQSDSIEIGIYNDMFDVTEPNVVPPVFWAEVEVY
jgi:hypothetical protein